jgi:hypothetical protein
MEFLIIVVLRFFTVEHLWTAEIMKKVKTSSETAEAIRTQQNFSKYHENACLT